MGRGGVSRGGAPNTGCSDLGLAQAVVSPAFASINARSLALQSIGVEPREAGAAMPLLDNATVRNAASRLNDTTSTRLN